MRKLVSHFLQSRAWQRYQESLGLETFELEGEGWRLIAIKEVHHGIRRLYVPYGPEADSPQALQEALRALEDLSKKNKCVFVRVEPTGEVNAATMRSLGYRPAPSIQPADTWCIDLTQDKKTLLKGIGSTNRNLLNGFSRRGMEITESTDPADIRYLAQILQQISSSKDDFVAHEQEYLQKQAESLFAQGAARLFIVRYGEEVIAASLVYEDSETRYYAHSGASLEHRKLRAGNVLVAYMMVDAKERGFKEFDLYGIAPEGVSEDHPWAGFTKFKKTFGGHQKSYIGTWEKAQNPFIYGLYNRTRHLADRYLS